MSHIKLQKSPLCEIFIYFTNYQINVRHFKKQCDRPIINKIYYAGPAQEGITLIKMLKKFA